MFDIVQDTNTNALNKGYKSANKNLRQGMTLGNNYLTSGKTEGLGYLDTGAQTADPYYAQAAQPFQGQMDRANQGMDSYWNLLTNPDSVFDSELYKSRESAGLDSINRMANSRGMLASGNNTQDILNYMRQGGLDYFNTLMQGYSPYFGMGQNAAQGLSQALQNRGNLWNQLGANKSNVATDAARGLSNNTMNTYGQIAQNKIGQGQDLTSIQMNDSAQDWNALLGMGKLAVGGATAYYGRK